MKSDRLAQGSGFRYLQEIRASGKSLLIQKLRLDLDRSGSEFKLHCNHFIVIAYRKGFFNAIHADAG